MSKAQYLLLAIFIGFYGLLFIGLMVRVLTGSIAARIGGNKPLAGIKGSRKQLKHGRAWTAAVWRNA